MPQCHLANAQLMNMNNPNNVIINNNNNTNQQQQQQPNKVDSKNSRCLFQTVQFALGIVRNPFVESEHYGKWLAVNETSGRGWWIPGGAVDRGETFSQACLRECLEEAGMQIRLKGILKVDHSVSGDVCRMRVIYYGEPTSAEQANNFKTVPDSESLEARWVSIEELLALASTPPGLRGRELLNWAMYLENNGHIFPLEIFSEEGELQPLGSQSRALLKQSSADRVGVGGGSIGSAGGSSSSFLPRHQTISKETYNTRVSSTITPEQRQFMEWANARRKSPVNFESV